MTMASDRILTCEGIHNFRDYGGYAVPGGGRLRRGILWRSAQHQDASDADLAQLETLDLGTVIDLRGDDERAAHPCRRPVGFAARVVFAPGITAGLAPHLQAAGTDITADMARQRMIAAYQGMPFRPVLVQALRAYFNVLTRSDSPSLVHCVAGKDRTGLAAALLHRLLGVHDDDVMADYLLTNVAGRIEERIAQGAAVIRARYGASIADDAIRTLMMVSPAYLDAAFDAIDTRHGSLDAYAEAVLELGPEQRAALADRLIA